MIKLLAPNECSGAPQVCHQTFLRLYSLHKPPAHAQPPL